jgi:hypothetical protein
LVNAGRGAVRSADPRPAARSVIELGDSKITAGGPSHHPGKDARWLRGSQRMAAVGRRRPGRKVGRGRGWRAVGCIGGQRRRSAAGAPDARGQRGRLAAFAVGSIGAGPTRPAGGRRHVTPAVDRATTRGDVARPTTAPVRAPIAACEPPFAAKIS